MGTATCYCYWQHLQAKAYSLSSMKLLMHVRGWIRSGPEEFADMHPHECENPWRNIGVLAELKKKALGLSGHSGPNRCLDRSAFRATLPLANCLVFSAMKITLMPDSQRLSQRVPPRASSQAVTTLATGGTSCIDDPTEQHLMSMLLYDWLSLQKSGDMFSWCENRPHPTPDREVREAL